MGGIWMTGAGENAPSLHPKQPPQNPKNTDFQNLLWKLVTNGTFEKIRKANEAARLLKTAAENKTE